MSDVFNVLDFGAFGNAQVNPQTPYAPFGIDDTAAIQAALNACGQFGSNAPYTGVSADQPANPTAYGSSRNQYILEFPPNRQFLISKTLLVPPGVEIRGNQSTIYQISDNEGFFDYSFNIRGLGNGSYGYAGLSRALISDLFMQGPGASTSTGYGVILAYATDFLFENLNIGGVKVGLLIQNSQYGKLHKVNCIGCHHGAILTGYPRGSWTPNATSINNGAGLETLGESVQQAGTSNTSIDIAIDTCRFAKSLGGYGLWLHQAANITLKQIDGNCVGCSPKAALVLGSALHDYISCTVSITNPGAGLATGSWPLTITNTKGTGSNYKGFAEVSNGIVTAAYVTEGFGNLGTLVNPVATIASGAGGTTQPTFQLTPVSDIPGYNYIIGDSSGSGDTGGAGLINLDNYKAEVDNSSTPDCGYMIYLSPGSSAVFQNTNISGYGLSKTSYYRLVLAQGIMEWHGGEFDNYMGTVPNPGDSPATDYGLFKTNTSLLWKPFHQIPTTNLYGYVIGLQNTPVLDGNVIVATNGQTTYASSTVIVGPAFAEQNALAIRTYQDTTNRFLTDQRGNFSWGPGGTSALDTTLSRNAPNSLSTGGLLTAQAFLPTSGHVPSAWYDDTQQGIWYAGGYLYIQVPAGQTGSGHIVRIPAQSWGGDTPAGAGTTI